MARDKTNSEGKKVVFRRIGGRVVPIPVNKARPDARSAGASRRRSGFNKQGIDKSKAAGHGRYRGVTEGTRSELRAGFRTAKRGDRLQKAGAVGVGLGLATGLAGAFTARKGGSLSSKAVSIGTGLMVGGAITSMIGSSKKKAGIHRGARAIIKDPNLRKKRRR